MALLGARLAMSGKKLSAKSYVQDGLLAMWDGTENIGWGKHSDTTILWKDLIGNCDVTSSTALGNYRYWDKDAFVFAVKRGDGLAGTPSDEMKNLGNTGVLTIECVWYAEESGSNNETLFQMSDGTLNDGLLFGTINSFSIMAGLSDTWASVRASNSLGSNWDFDSILHKSTYVCDGSTGVMTTNRSGVATAITGSNKVVVPSSVATGADSFYIGSYSWNTGRNRILIGGIKNLRIYKKALKDTEIAANFEVDKARFGIT